MSYSRMYTDAVGEVLRLKDAKAARKRQLAQELSHDNTLGASLEHVLNGRVATDPYTKDLQILIDRAVAEATMYGVGAMARNLAFLAKRMEENR